MANYEKLVKLQELGQKYDDSFKSFKELFKESFFEAVAEIFETYPNLNQFSFEAWTIGFNDGDPCYYGVYAEDGHVTMNGSTLEDVEGYSWDEESRNMADTDKWLLDAEKDIQKVAYGIPSDILQSIFEEGRLVFNRDGSHEVEDVYHD